MADQNDIIAQIKQASARIKRDAVTIQELTKFKDAAALIIDMVAKGDLDPRDGPTKLSILISAADYPLEKRAIEMTRGKESGTKFGTLINLPQSAPNNESPEAKLIQDLRQLNKD